LKFHLTIHAQHESLIYIISFFIHSALQIHGTLLIPQPHLILYYYCKIGDRQFTSGIYFFIDPHFIEILELILKPLLLNNPLLRPIFYGFASVSLFILGWKTKGRMPDIKKFILVAAPHSSNWDFIYFLLIVFKFHIPAHWMAKNSMFFWPFKGLLKRLGGIPIDRSKKGNLVTAMVDTFNQADRLIITIAPSGTRKKVTQWKTGFYQIASQANIPIVCGFVDYKNKRGGIGPVIHPTGDMDADMQTIKKFYEDKSGRYS
jgi:1-acyl-sn-glycerol-3-phosphate acyltransferase